MRATSRTARTLLGVAAGVTVTALFGASLAMPANAAPADPPGFGDKIKLADLANTSRVVKDRYLVQIEGSPMVVGGTKSRVRSSQDRAKSAASAAGAKVQRSYGDLWNGLAVTATDEQVKQLAKSPAVKAIYPVLKVDLPKTTKSTTKASSALAEIAGAGTGFDGAGIKVGIIDTGVDYDHPDLGGTGTDGGPFPTTRVAYGYDFVGDAYDSDQGDSPQPDSNPDDCNGHGTHVAGIVGAQGDGDGASVTGVAPAATLGAYRVFGCEGSTDTAVIVAALERAHSDGMDVVNLSLGSDFASWPDYPDAVAAANLADDGVVVVVSAGNAGEAGLFAAGTPAVGEGVISVASYEAEKIRTKAIGVGVSKFAYSPMWGTQPAPAHASTMQLRAASSLTACKTLAAVPAGTALLVKDGSCSDTTKVKKAIAAGADAVVIYNTSSSLLDLWYDSSSVAAKPAISIGGTAGESLYKAIKAAATKSVPMTWLDYQSDLVNPNGGKLSKFSSAGLAADLSLVPTISAPGGRIYSTMPLELDGYANMSGTSMASPFVAGSVAQLLQARPELLGNPEAVSTLLYNTAVHVPKATESGVTKYPEAVFRQGAGVIKLDNAIGAKVTASPSVLELGEGTSDIVTVTLTNKTAETLTYKPSRVSGVSAAASTGSATYVGTSTPKYAYGTVGFKSYTSSVTLAPGASGTFKLKLTAPTKALKGKAGMLYGGWVKFTTAGGGNAVSVPFVGLRGDYQKVKLLNKFRLVDANNKKWSLPRLGVETPEGQFFLGSTRSNYWDFDMSEWYPGIIYHLDYPASDLRLKVINTKTKKSYYAIIDWSASSAEAATHWGPQPRDAGAQGVFFYGYYLNNGFVEVVPNGNYQLQLRVLKPLGKASTSSHWETYTSPKFYIIG